MLTIGSLFSGYGGLDLAVETVLNARTVWHVENNPAAARVLAHHWPDVPNHGDITRVDWSTVEPVDIVAGGFPCQDVSSAAAGARRGLRPGTRSGLWSQMAYAVAQLRPQLVVVENVRGVLSAEAHSDVEPCPHCLGDQPGTVLRALGAVLGDLAQLGYDARWCGLRAADVGAPHGRFRVFVVAADTRRLRGHPWWIPAPRRTEGGWALGEPVRHGQGVPVADWGKYEPAIRRWERITGRPAPAPTVGRRLNPAFVEWMMGLDDGWVTAVPHDRDTMLPGLPAEVTDAPSLRNQELLTLLGNGVVPQQAAEALRALLEGALGEDHRLVST